MSNNSSPLQNAVAFYNAGNFLAAEQILASLVSSNAHQSDVPVQVLFVKCLCELNKYQQAFMAIKPLMLRFQTIEESQKPEINKLINIIVGKIHKDSRDIFSLGKYMAAEQLLKPIATMAGYRDNYLIQLDYAQFLSYLGEKQDALKILEHLVPIHSNAHINLLINEIKKDISTKQNNSEQYSDLKQNLTKIEQLHSITTSNRFKLRLKRGLKSYLKIHFFLIFSLFASLSLFILEQDYLSDYIQYNLQISKIIQLSQNYRGSRIFLVLSLFPLGILLWLLIPGARPIYEFVIDKGNAKTNVMYIKQGVFITNKTPILLANVANASFKQSIVWKLTTNSGIILKMNKGQNLEELKVWIISPDNSKNCERLQFYINDWIMATRSGVLHQPINY